MIQMASLYILGWQIITQYLSKASQENTHLLALQFSLPNSQLKLLLVIIPKCCKNNLRLNQPVKRHLPYQRNTNTLKIVFVKVKSQCAP